MYLSIVIPAYNEEVRIVSTLEAAALYLDAKGYDYEIIVVDDGSSDRTVEKVREAAGKHSGISVVENGVNRGKGYSVRAGVAAARGEFVFFTDADLSTPIEELENFFAAIKDRDIVIGSRAIKGAHISVHEPLYRELLGRSFSVAVGLLCVSGYTDTQCGAKLFRMEAARKIFPRQKLFRFAFDVELLYLAKRFGFTVTEMPINWRYSTDTRVRPFRDGFRMLYDIARIRFLHWGDK